MKIEKNLFWQNMPVEVWNQEGEGETRSLVLSELYFNRTETELYTPMLSGD